MFQGPPGSRGPPGPSLNLTLLQLKVIKGVLTPDPVALCLAKAQMSALPPSPAASAAHSP